MIKNRIRSAYCVILLAASITGCLRASPTLATEPGRSTDPLLVQARAYERSGDYVRAEQYLSAALTAGANENRILPLQVRVCLADQRYRDAEQYLENYLRRHPTKQSARFLLATLHMALGHNELARRELARVVHEDPRQADAHFALATLLREQGLDYAEADTHFRAYLALNPEGPHAEEARGSLMTAVP